jgi:hypothetical protein
MAVLDGWPPARVSGCTEPGLQASSPAAWPAEACHDAHVLPSFRVSVIYACLAIPTRPLVTHRAMASLRVSTWH